MKKNKYFICLLIILISTSMPVFAKFETWLGTSLTSHTALLDDSEKINFKTISNNTSLIENVVFIGPSLDISIFPENRIPLGIRFSSDILFPIGYNSGKSFRSYKGDFKNRNMIGLEYAQTYGDGWGLFAEIGYEFDLYRIAQSNKVNNKQKPEYNIFTNNALYGELGILTAIENGYFKFGLNYSHSVENKTSSYDIICSGGYIF